MKKLYTFLVAALIAVNIFAQAPNMLSYQAVIRNSSNQLVTGKTVGMRVSILQGSSSGNPVYVETQTPTTNSNGLITIRIGGGTVVSGDFATINWAEQSFYLKTETDPNGGTNYTITGASQMLSVPYALYASKTGQYSELDPIFNSKFDLTGAAANDILRYNGVKWEKFTPNYLTTEVDGSITNELELPSNATAGDMAYFNGTNWISVPKGADGQVLSIQSGIPQWKSSQAASLTPPTVVTGQPNVQVDEDGYTKIKFTGTVNPNGLETNVSFDVWHYNGYLQIDKDSVIGYDYEPKPRPYYGFNNNYVEAEAQSHDDNPIGLTDESQDVLFRIKASNSAGVSYGQMMTLSLPCVKPYLRDYCEINNFGGVSINLVEGYYSMVILNGKIEWGTTQSYGNETSLMVDGQYSRSVTLDNLLEGTTYHYRVVLTNRCGTTIGEDKTFTTPSTITAPPSATTGGVYRDWNSNLLISKSSATIEGIVNANNLNTTVSFEYGLTSSYGSNVNAHSLWGGSPILTNNRFEPVIAEITGLIAGTTYHYRIKAENSSGITYGEDKTFKTHTYAKGDNAFGGIVIYVDETGEHGLVCAPNDQSTGVAWSNGSLIITGATSADGQSNTSLIVSKQGDGNYAAKICDDLVLNGYDDWFLPSTGELDLMTSALNVARYSYWSSTELDISNALSADLHGNFPKEMLRKVRAVRKF